MPTIAIHGLTVGYDGRPAVREVSGSFTAPGLHAIVGPNGGGKSTLLKAIMGLVRPQAGRVDLDGVGREQIAYLPQQADIDRTFPISVLDVVLLGDWRRSGAFGRVSAASRAAAEAALMEVGLDGFARRAIGNLSAGQLQRVLFARIVLQDSAVILLDEPFAGMDMPTTTDLLRLIQRWHRQGRTVVAVLHDLAMVRAQFPSTLLLAQNVVAWGPTEAALTRDHLLRAWGVPPLWDEPPAPAPCPVGAPA